MAKQRAVSEETITGAQCQYARNKLGLTQAKLAKELGVSRSQIANFETKGERFTPSEEVRRKLREYFEQEMPGVDEVWPEGAPANGGDDDNGGSVRSNTMRYMQRFEAVGCFRMSGDLSEAQRDRLLDEIDKVRDRLEEIATSPAKPGVFDQFDTATDELITEADALVKKFGFLCVVAFGYGFISLPTPALLDRKKRPEDVADALALKYSDVFKAIGIKKRDSAESADDKKSLTLMG